MAARVSVLGQAHGLVVERLKAQSVLPGAGPFVDSVQDIVLTDYAPVSDKLANSWVPSVGTSLYGCVDENPADDADYITSPPNPGGTFCDLQFAVQPPVADTGHTISYRIKTTGGIPMTVRLFQTGLMIKEWVHNPGPSNYTTFNQTLTPAEADTITNYPSLWLRFIAG